MAIKQLGHSDASCIGRYVDPRFTSNHEAAKLLARPGWDGRRLVVEVKPDVDADSLPPRIVRLSRSDWQGDGLGILAPLANPDGFTGEDLAKVLEHLGIHVKDFAELIRDRPAESGGQSCEGKRRRSELLSAKRFVVPSG